MSKYSICKKLVSTRYPVTMIFIDLSNSSITLTPPPWWMSDGFDRHAWLLWTQKCEGLETEAGAILYPALLGLLLIVVQDDKWSSLKQRWLLFSLDYILTQLAQTSRTAVVCHLLLPPPNCFPAISTSTCDNVSSEAQNIYLTDDHSALQKTTSVFKGGHIILLTRILHLSCLRLG